MATITDVARRAGVSAATVSRVTNGRSLVSERTRRKVLKAIADLNYSPSFVAQWLRGTRTRSIGVVIPDFTNYYYSALLNMIEREARLRGYLSIFCTTETDVKREQEYIDDLVRRQVDGVILCLYRGVRGRSTYLTGLCRKLPVVVMDQPASGLPASSVYTDGFKGIRLLVGRLIAGGHRSIGIIRGLQRYAAVQSRYEGYVAAMEEAGMVVYPSNVAASDFTIEGGYAATGELLSRCSLTALVAVDDLMAVGAAKYCREHGIAIPRELAISGFDDIPLASLVSPSLTTIRQPVAELARTATRHLVDRVESADIPCRHFAFEPEVVWRESMSPGSI